MVVNRGAYGFPNTIAVYMKKYLLFTLLALAIVAMPESASAYSYGRGVYSQKTTAYSGVYYPRSMNSYYGYSYNNSLREINPFEARRVDYVVSQERYQRQLAEIQAKADARYAMERAQRQNRDAQVLAQIKQMRAANEARARQAGVRQYFVGKPASPRSTAPIVTNDDFDVLSNSLEKDTNLGYRQPQKQSAGMNTDRPSFLQRLKWALFGRS